MLVLPTHINHAIYDRKHGIGLILTADLSPVQVLTSVELQKFLVEQQGEHLNEADLDELLERHEPDPALRAMGRRLRVT